LSPSRWCFPSQIRNRITVVYRFRVLRQGDPSPFRRSNVPM
jgi:hypothetical protein